MLSQHLRTVICFFNGLDGMPNSPKLGTPRISIWLGRGCCFGVVQYVSSTLHYSSIMTSCSFVLCKAARRHINLVDRVACDYLDSMHVHWQNDD